MFLALSTSKVIPIAAKCQFGTKVFIGNNKRQVA
jgi:hypothetical protein